MPDQQELEFQIWGLSRIARRNIIVFFILCLISAIAALSRVIVIQNQQLQQVNQQLLNSKDQGALKIEELKNENLKTILRINELLIRQDQIREEIRSAKTTLNEVKKNFRK